MTSSCNLINQESVLKPSTYKKLQKKQQSQSVQKDDMYINDKHLHDYNDILGNIPFRKLLEWKYQQELLFCNDNKTKDAFWINLSNKLIELEDPADIISSKYSPLKLDKTHYKSLVYKYPTSYNKITKDLSSCSDLCNNTIKEILYQSNPSLIVLESVNDYIAFNEQILDKLCTKFNDDLLREFSIQYSSDEDDIDNVEPVPSSPITPFMDDIIDNFEWDDIVATYDIMI